jgi:transposase
MGHKYVGLDVHQSSTAAAVPDEQGKSVMESILTTGGEAIRDFLKGLRGTIHATFEEGTQASWLYEIVKPVVAEVIVCNPRMNKLLAVGNKAERVDAHKLAELLRCGQLKPVYHGTRGVWLLKELAHSYGTLVGDTTRVMNRVKAIYRGRAIRCAGRDVYYQRNREQWLEKLSEPGVGQRARFLYHQLDTLRGLRREARKTMLKESRRHPAYPILKEIPVLGQIRIAQILAKVASPHRFRTKRQFWAYCGLAVVTRSSADYHFVEGKAEKRKLAPLTRGRNPNINHRLKYVFKSAALDGIHQAPFEGCYARMVTKGIRPGMARLTLARKIAAVTLTLWKRGERFDELKLSEEAA